MCYAKVVFADENKQMFKQIKWNTNYYKHIHSKGHYSKHSFLRQK